MNENNTLYAICTQSAWAIFVPVARRYGIDILCPLGLYAISDVERIQGQMNWGQSSSQADSVS